MLQLLHFTLGFCLLLICWYGIPIIVVVVAILLLNISQQLIIEIPFLSNSSFCNNMVCNLVDKRFRVCNWWACYHYKQHTMYMEKNLWSLCGVIIQSLLNYLIALVERMENISAITLCKLQAVFFLPEFLLHTMPIN